MGKGAVMQADRDGHAGSGRAGEKRGRRDWRIKGRRAEREDGQTPREETVQGKRGRFETGRRNKEMADDNKINKNQEVRQTYCHSSAPTEHTRLSQ